MPSPLTATLNNLALLYGFPEKSLAGVEEPEAPGPQEETVKFPFPGAGTRALQTVHAAETKENPPVSTDDMTEHDKFHRAIAELEDQQRSLGLDLTQQIAELRRRLEEVETSPQSGSGGAAISGGTAAGDGGIAVGGHVFGDIYHVYQSPLGRMALSREHFERILQDYLPVGTKCP